MLRASSLGLRCYSHTLHSAFLQCHPRLVKAVVPHSKRFASNIGQGVPPADLDSSRTSGQSDVGDSSVEDQQQDTESFQSAEEEKEDQLSSSDFPRGNRHRKPVLPLSSSTMQRYKWKDRVIKRENAMQIVPRTDKTGATNAKDIAGTYARFEVSVQQTSAALRLGGNKLAFDHVQHILPPHIPGKPAVGPLGMVQEEEKYHDPTLSTEQREIHDKALDVLAETTSIPDAWSAYQTLMALPRNGTRLRVPWQHLHRLTRLIAGVRPRTRTLFVQLLSVMSTIHRSGGTIQLWQWNALIDFAGKGWRKTRTEDFKTALDVYHDLISHKPPGATFSRKQGSDLVDIDEVEEEASLEPDIVTYTTLLHIAARTSDEQTFRHGYTLLESSGLPANRITLLALIRYHTHRGDPEGVRTLLRKIRASGFPLGLDGINACVWAFARHGRLDSAMQIYRVLQANLTGTSNQKVRALKRSLEAEGIPIPRKMVPDHITYISLIQALATHGDLPQCLQVFIDMITALRPSLDAPGEKTADAPSLLPAYRAVFHGFYRHAPGASALSSHGSGSRQSPVLRSKAESSKWNQDTLEMLYSDFLGLPKMAQPSERLIYWLLMAFAKVSEDDMAKLREVYSQLEVRFGGQWGGRLAVLKEKIYKTS